MSREALEKIKSAEAHAKITIENAGKDGKEIVRSAEEEISAERKIFSEKLRAERNERLRRSDMQIKSMEESAAAEAEKEAEQAMQKYKAVHEAAVSAAIKVLLR